MNSLLNKIMKKQFIMCYFLNILEIMKIALSFVLFEKKV